MSFKCQICNQVGSPHEKPVRVVSETRQVEYPARKVRRKRGPEDKFGERFDIDPGGTGTEIVREVVCHAGCAPGK